MAAILDNGLGALAIDLLDLRERLEADRDAAAEFPQPRLRVLQPFDPAERIQFVDVKPDTPFERRLERQRLQTGNVHPARDQPPQRRDLVGGVGHPSRTAFAAPPAPDREGPRSEETRVGNEWVSKCRNRG